jgi:excisionase family DNA binding protein
MSVLPIASPYLTQDEAARYLRVCKRTFRDRVQAQLRPVRVGARLLFTVEDLDAWADRARDGHSASPEGQGTATPSASPRRRANLGKSPRAREIRVALTLADGPPRGLALHHCDNPECVNPLHLYWGTHQDNANDRERRKRSNPPKGDLSGSRKYPERRPRGPRLAELIRARTPRGERNASSKLTARDVERIRADTRPHAHVAKEFDVSPQVVSLIRAGKAWSHIELPAEPITIVRVSPHKGLANPKAVDLSGRRFGRLLVTASPPVSRGGVHYWTCICDCGNERMVRTAQLLNGGSQSCGCLSREKARARMLGPGNPARRRAS